MSVCSGTARYAGQASLFVGAQDGDPIGPEIDGAHCGILAADEIAHGRRKGNVLLLGIVVDEDEHRFP